MGQEPICGSVWVSLAMLQAIDDNNLEHALALLREGFPGRDEAFWRIAVNRIKNTGDNQKLELPIGYLMKSGDGASGVVLTPAREHTNSDGTTQRVINLSSWYVRDHDRWRAPMMMRKLLSLENASFTDLTPTPSVQAMLKTFGFEKINSGVSLNILPLARLKGARGARVVPMSELAGETSASETWPSPAAYEALNCLVAVLIDGEEQIPLVFKRLHRQKVPLAMLIYSENNEAVYRNLAAIGAYLSRFGIHVLVLDIPTEGQIPGIPRKKRGNKFARGVKANNQTDYLGTELSLFDW